MLPYRDGKITKVILAAFFLLVLGYAYFEAQGILFGPKITVASSVTEVHDPFVKVQGRADRIASLAMNGKPITVTEGGDFSEPYLLTEGANRIVLDAADKYGRTRRQIIEIVYVPLTPDAIQVGAESAATSTSPTSTPPVAR